MVWNNVKFYVLAFAIVLMGSLVSTGLQLLESLFPEIHPLNKLFANLSGVTMGGVIMVLAFLRDNRVDQERKRAERYEQEASNAKAEASNAKAEASNAKAEASNARAEASNAKAEAKSAQDHAKWWQEKAERAEAELADLRSQFQAGDVLARLRRLEERYGVDDAENRLSD